MMNDQQRMEDIAATMSETEQMWVTICAGVDESRVDMLVEAMAEQHNLIMTGETNANAVMALVGFLSQQVLKLHAEGEMSVESAMVLMQIGMQRGVQAHLAVDVRKGAS